MPVDPTSLLTELRAALAEATPGEWAANPYSNAHVTRAAAWLSHPDGEISDCIWREADAHAVVWLRNSVPRIEAALAQADADRAELERLRAFSAAAEISERAAHERWQQQTRRMEAELEQLRRVELRAARLLEQRGVDACDGDCRPGINEHHGACGELRAALGWGGAR